MQSVVEGVRLIFSIFHLLFSCLSASVARSLREKILIEAQRFFIHFLADSNKNEISSALSGHEMLRRKFSNLKSKSKCTVRFAFARQCRSLHGSLLTCSLAGCL